MLYRKIQNDFDFVEQTDAKVLSFKDDLMRFLTTDQVKQNKLALDRLSLCMSHVALMTCFNAWSNCIEDLQILGKSDA